MQSDGKPCFVDNLGSPLKLGKADLEAFKIDEMALPMKLEPVNPKNEDFLKTVMDESPEILPISEIDSNFRPIVSLGREFEVIVGGKARLIDNLFISPYGEITMVEAKLSMTSESSRELIGQLVLYAKGLSKMSYDEIERQTINQKGHSPLELVNNVIPRNIDQSEFVDRIMQNLRNKHFLVLVVVDKIREKVQEILEIFREDTPTYGIGLVELNAFKFEPIPGRLVIPQVRAIPKVIGYLKREFGQDRNLSKDYLSKDELDFQTRDIFEKIIVTLKEIGFKTYYVSKKGRWILHLPVSVPNVTKKKKIRFIVLEKNGEIRPSGGLVSELKNYGLNTEPAKNMIKELFELFGIEKSPGKKRSTSSPYITSKEVREKYEEFVRIITTAVEKINGSIAEQG